LTRKKAEKKRTLGWMKAESYLAENDYLIFVTANPEVFARVYEALRQVG
jgi:hypothetical protein